MRRKWILVLLGLAAGTATLLFFLKEEGDPLTREALDKARRVWAEHDIRDYDMTVTVTGRQSGDHKIEVRGGSVATMTTGGAPTPEHVWKYWDVTGMFVFLKTELGNAERPRAAYGVKDADDVVLLVSFDEEYGYPRRFLRHVLGRNTGIEWKVTAFDPK